MKKYILGLILIISPLFILAHNPLSAKYYLESGKNASLLNINLSQDGVNKVLLDKYGKVKLDQMDQKEFKELIIDYIKTNFHLSANQKNITLNKGGIKLGSHQTDLKFVLPPIPESVQEFSVHIPAFLENGNHQTIFSYNHYGFVDKVILDKKNNYKSKIGISKGSTPKKTNWTIEIALLITSLLLLFLLYRFKKHKS